MINIATHHKKEILLIITGAVFALITATLANGPLRLIAAFLIPATILVIFIITSTEFSAYLVIFALFSGIFWGLEISGGFLFVTLIFIFAWFLKQFGEAEPKLFLDKTLFAILMYYFFLIASIPDARWPIASYDVLMVYFKLLLFYFIFTNAIDEEKVVKRLTRVLIAAVIISVAYGFYTLLVALGQGKLFETGFRLIGLSANPNALSYYILISIALSSYFFFLTAKKWYIKLSLIFIIIYLTIAQGATLSRGGSIGLAILFLLVIWDFRSRKWPVVAVIAFILIILLFAPKEYFERLSSLSNIWADPSLRWRARLSLGAIELIQQYPFNGLGLGNFLVISNKYINHHLVTHNTLLEVFSESGFAAVVSLVVLVIVVFRNLNYASSTYLKKANYEMYAISRAFRSSLVALCVLSLFDSMQTYFSIWAIFAFSAILNKLARKAEEGQ
ncbi:MAG: hypothetical protein D6814_15185 [Calditrichaeota bacterium]|nr:MAG: hypothetical protein D6814_15185 [Calditrichota bacterium]